MSRRFHTFGFSLLELAAVLLILAVIAGLGLSATLGALESTKRTVTEKRLDVIENALMAYRIAHNSLPSPLYPLLPANFGTAMNNEVQNYCCGGAGFITSYMTGWAATGENSTYSGAVPVSVLNLPVEFAYDGWGRQFKYVVTYAATLQGGFVNMIHPWDSTCYNGIQVNDATGAARTNGAMYVLVSFGPNGHGAYNASGEVISANSVNTDEQTNCQCDSNTNELGVNNLFVQKEATEDPGNPYNNFDDIVRYKTRWQMQTPDDQYIFAYHGPEIAVGYSSGTQLLNYQCGLMTPTISPVLPGSNALVAFTPHNQHLFTYSQDSGGTCKLYKITGSSYADLGTGVVDNCPSNGTNLAMSGNGDLVMALSSSPYIQVWKLSGDHFYSVLSPLAPTLSAMPRKMTITDDGNTLTLTDGSFLSTGTYAAIYRRNVNGQYQPDATQPSGIVASGVVDLTMAADGGLLIESYEAASVPHILMWRKDARGLFTAMSPGPYITSDWTGSPAFIYDMKFSPDSKHMLFIQTTLGLGTTGQLYRGYVDPMATTSPVTRILNPNYLNNGDNQGEMQLAESASLHPVYAFSGDSSYAMLAVWGTAGNMYIMPYTNPSWWGAMFNPYSVVGSTITSIATAH